MRVLATTPAGANSEEGEGAGEGEGEGEGEAPMMMIICYPKKQNTSDVMFFYFPSSITIKLKCFSNIIVIGSFNRISDIL